MQSEVWLWQHAALSGGLWGLMSIIFLFPSSVHPCLPTSVSQWNLAATKLILWSGQLDSKLQLESPSSSLWASASVGLIFSWWRVKFYESLTHWLKVLERKVGVVVELTSFTADSSLCSVYYLWLHQLGRGQHSACSPCSFLGPLLAELLN